MKLIACITRQGRLDAVLNALREEGVRGVTVSGGARGGPPTTVARSTPRSYHPRSRSRCWRLLSIASGL